MTQNRMICQHVFMIERLMRYAVWYDWNVNGSFLEKYSQSSNSLSSRVSERLGDPLRVENL